MLDYVLSLQNPVQVLTSYLYSNPAIIFPFKPKSPPPPNFYSIGYSNSFVSLTRERHFIPKVSPLHHYVSGDGCSYQPDGVKVGIYLFCTLLSSRPLLVFYLFTVLWGGGGAVAQWLRCCATNRKVTGSIPAGVSGSFIDIKSFRSHCGPGVDSASNRNEYQEHFLGVKAAGT